MTNDVVIALLAACVGVAIGALVMLRRQPPQQEDADAVSVLDAQNVLNHPQFANPNGQLGNSAFGTISAMLASPSCATCGTVERQIQLAVKLRF